MAVPKRLRFEVFRRDGYTCRYCGRSAPDFEMTIDHVVPEVLGGPDEPANLVTACADCNSGKTSIAPDAPLVAQVAEDALRWATARRTAAYEMLEERDARVEQHERFLARWNEWGWGEESNWQTEPLPATWNQSVDQFINAGLPMDIIIDSLNQAQSNLNVRDTFKYFCGIAWARVRDLNERTTRLVQADTLAGSPDDPWSAHPASSRSLPHLDDVSWARL